MLRIHFHQFFSLQIHLTAIKEKHDQNNTEVSDQGRGVLSSNRLKGMCHWMGSYHNRVTFSIELQQQQQQQQHLFKHDKKFSKS